MTRLVPVTVLMAILAASRVAGAEDLSTTLSSNGATIVFEHLEVEDADGDFFEPEIDDRPLYFNLAHCNCGQKDKSTFKYLVRETMTSGVSQPLVFFVGQNCAVDNTTRTNNCKRLADAQVSDVDTLNPSGRPIDFNLHDIVNGLLHQNDECQPIEGAATLWAFVDTKNGSTDNFDFGVTQNVGTLAGDPSTTTGVDTRPPPAPIDVSAAPNEGAIDVFWTPPESNNTDIAYYQALCATMDGMPVPGKGGTARYVTTQSVCGETAPIEKLAEQPIGNGEAGVSLDENGAFDNLDSNFICGEISSGTSSSLTIKGLENGIPYKVILLAVDLHGNFTGTLLTNTITPHLVTDFWEDLHNRGSDVEGGLCLLAETYGDDGSLTNTLREFRDDTLASSRFGRWLTAAYYATLGKLGTSVHGSLALRVVAAILLLPAVIAALLWHWLSLPGMIALLVAAFYLRRNRRAIRGWSRWALRSRLVRNATMVALMSLGASQARADGGFRPYWEANDSFGSEQENQVAADDPSLVRWHVGVRVGPYVPDIDKQLGTKPGPYEQMFPGTRWLPMLDVDRIIWTGFGQVGVGGSIGYMQRTARAFVMGSDDTDPDRPRERGARNAFRMIPFALTATYRFTWLDDQYGIPLVPYVRGGLAYYAWWVNAPSGDFAKICDEDDMCDNKALGASLGLQGSIGLAIRAERIDADTALSMRASGIQHVGIYGELSASKIDGFGSDSKLSVGDRSWSAGVNFEF